MKLTRRQIKQRPLTARQHETWSQLAQGKTSKEIAKAMGIAPSTVDHHLEIIGLKKGATRRIRLIALYYADTGTSGPRRSIVADAKRR